MKKYLIGFGLSLIFFAGFTTAQTTENSESWKPEFADTGNKYTYKDCRDNEAGFWINIVGEKKDTKHCLNKDVCSEGLEISYKTKGGKEVITKGIFFVMKDKDDVTCDKEGTECTIASSDDKKVAVKCYKDAKFSVRQYTKSDFCKVPAAEVVQTIPAIDDPEKRKGTDNFPEWYCPEADDDYPSLDGKTANPYAPEGKYFTDHLKEHYLYLPTESELIKHCSLRMFALMKSCTENAQQKSGIRGKLEQLRRDYYTKKTIMEWRGKGKMIESKGIDALNQWNEISNLKFSTICGTPTSAKKCDETIHKDFKNNKLDAYKAVQKWLNGDGRNFQKDATTPAEHFKELAKKAWGKEEAKITIFTKKATDLWGKDAETDDAIKKSNKKTLESKMGKIYDEDEKEELSDLGWTGSGPASAEYSKLMKTATDAEESAKKTAKYISDRNMSLNISVSIGQTAGINISKYLRVSDNSDESKLTIFNNDGTDDINIFDKIIRLAVRTMGTLAILLLIISGVLMIVSQGDDNQLEKAKTVFIYTLLGLAVGFLSYTIVRFIIDTLLS